MYALIFFSPWITLDTFLSRGSSAYVDGGERPLLSKSQFDTNYNDVPHNSRIGFSFTIAVHKALKKRYLFTLLNKNVTLFLSMQLRGS